VTARRSEHGSIEELRRIFESPGVRDAGIAYGIGDDAAVLAPPSGREVVWTVDVQVEGRHFRRAWLSLEDIGFRSFVAAASDVFAMGAAPWCALSSLVVPADVGDDALLAIARGQAEAARAVGAPIVGGNLSRGAELSLTTTLLGHATRAVRRDGAKAGDGVWVAGTVGLAAIGLRALSLGREDDLVRDGLRAFRRPAVRREEARGLEAAHAAIDLSDGLSQDAGHLASQSGVAIVIDQDALLAHVGDGVFRAAMSLGSRVVDVALDGGEDYALLATAAEPLAGFTRIGDVEAGEGVWLRDYDGRQRRVLAGGFDHFTSPSTPPGECAP
jgi:thiamine-monophosphate kinase